MTTNNRRIAGTRSATSSSGGGGCCSRSLPNPGAEPLCQHRPGDVPLPAAPPLHLVVVQPRLALRYPRSTAEPAGRRYRRQFGQRRLLRPVRPIVPDLLRRIHRPPRQHCPTSLRPPGPLDRAGNAQYPLMWCSPSPYRREGWGERSAWPGRIPESCYFTAANPQRSAGQPDAAAGLPTGVSFTSGIGRAVPCWYFSYPAYIRTISGHSRACSSALA